jgi:drug/metabolite transporter (DMT)-like permease
VVTVGLAFLFLGERLTAGQGAGVLAALAGVVLVSLQA